MQTPYIMLTSYQCPIPCTCPLHDQPLHNNEKLNNATFLATTNPSHSGNNICYPSGLPWVGKEVNGLTPRKTLRVRANVHPPHVRPSQDAKRRKVRSVQQEGQDYLVHVKRANGNRGDFEPVKVGYDKCRL